MISITLSKRRRDCILGSRDSHRLGHLVGAVIFEGMAGNSSTGARQESRDIAEAVGIRGSRRPR
jgi:hypothetical protein